MSERNFFAELKRRNVHKVAVAYIVGGWALAQGIAQVFPVFEVSNWAIRLIVLLIIIGFPVALILSWFLEITPEGIKATGVADAMAPTAKHKNRVWIYVVIVGAAVSIGLFFLGRYTAAPKGFPSSDSVDESVAVMRPLKVHWVSKLTYPFWKEIIRPRSSSSTSKVRAC